VWLDQGVVHADVVPGGEWRVVAGPYTVEVIGTVFAVHWSSAERELRVVLHRGTVVVRGTGFESGITLRAGQTLWASSDDAELEVRDTAAEPSASGEPDPPQTGGSEDRPSPLVEGAEADAPAAGEDAAAGADRTEAGRSRRNRRASRAPSSGPSESLESLAAAGRYAEVYEQARERGMDRLLAQGPLEELVALADAARYTGRTRLAADALGAQRERFPRSGPGRAASFLLGRLAEERQGDAGAALRWYGTYLRESPRGPLAGEALGRRMLLEQASGRDGAARRSARAYLERYPTGPHASTARRLREAESSALP
jgi:TolA-binding protein